jgi:hypothetical protein
MRLVISALSARSIDGAIYVAIDEGGRCRVSELKNGDWRTLISIQGSPCVLL